MTAVTGPKSSPKPQTPQAPKNEPKKNPSPQQPKDQPKGNSKNQPENTYSRPDPQPKKGDAKAPEGPKAADAPKAPQQEAVKDANGQQVKDKEGNAVVKDANGVNVASDPKNGEPVKDPKTGNPVILDELGNPGKAPDSIKPDPNVKTTDPNSPDYPKHHTDEKTGKTTFYDKDNKEIPQNGPGSPVAVYTDKEGQDHYYDRQTGQKIDDPNDPRLPKNLPKDGPNALAEPPASDEGAPPSNETSTD